MGRKLEPLIASEEAIQLLKAALVLLDDAGLCLAAARVADALAIIPAEFSTTDLHAGDVTVENGDFRPSWGELVSHQIVGG